MAQTIETNRYITIKFPLTRGDEETSRSINLPVPKELITSIETAFNGLIAQYSAGGSHEGVLRWLFQPTNWRDTDDAEEAWECADPAKITYEVVETTRTSGGYEPTP